ncbi:MAG: hypothetical protein ABIG68_07895, partial [Acidobacteriota bacterium]
IMWFDSIAAVREFAGENYEAAVVPVEARELLSRFDARSQHYEVLVEGGSQASGAVPQLHRRPVNRD